MSDLDELVPRVPPVSMRALESIGAKVLDVLYPEALQTPMAVDFLELVDRRLPRFGIFIYPSHSDELGDREAFTDSHGSPGDPINIMVSLDIWNDLESTGRRANRARATIAHELAHAILHVPFLRQRSGTSESENLLLSRRRRDELRPYEDPEWQAWALAGCIVAPRRTLDLVADKRLSVAAGIYGVSEAMMRSHLHRIGLARTFA